MNKKVLSALGFAAFLLAGCNNESASIGVIGGADGPTAVYVTSPISSSAYVTGGAVILAVLAVAGFILWRRRK